MDQREASLSMYIHTFSALCSAMSMGCVLAWSSPALASMAEESSSPRLHPNNDDDQNYKSWIGSCINLAALAGCFASSFIISWFGRRWSLILLALPFTLGWALISFANSFLVVIVGRSITGFTAGIVSSVAPGYVSEIVTPKTRGFLGSCFQVMVVVGILYVGCFGTFLTWKQLSIVTMVPVVFGAVGMFFAPESPIRLIERGDKKGALSALRKLRNAKSDVEAEMSELQDRIEMNEMLNSGNSGGLSLFKRPDIYNPVIITILLMIFQQFSGINAVLFYLVNIFQDSGSSIDSQLASILVDIAQVIATISAAIFMDKFGRKMLLIISGVGHLVTLAIMGLYYFKIYPENGWIPVACLIVFVMSFSFGYGPIPWLLVGEITPNEAMSMVAAIGASTNWISSFLITKEFEQMSHTLTKQGTYWLFAGFSAASIVYTYFFVPETKNTSIEDIQKRFLKK